MHGWVDLMPLFMLLDMDYFFAACEEARRPELKGKPFVVGTSPEKDKLHGVVQTSNYVARQFGIKSGMAVSKAVALCPDLKYSESHEDYYEEMSKRVMDIVRKYGFPMEIMSIDECALRLGEMGMEAAMRLSTEIKEKIRNETLLTCTIGISSSKIYAKMVCDSAKPDGLQGVEGSGVVSFIRSKEVSKIPGIGPKAEEELRRIGISKIEDAIGKSPMLLMDRLGSLGTFLYRVANGLDESDVEENYQMLSIGRETTLAYPPTKESIMEAMERLTDQTISEVLKKKMMFRGVSVKVRYTDFTEKIRSTSIKNYTDSKELLAKKALTLIEGLLDAKPVRKIGVRVYMLSEASGQSTLF